MKSNFYKINSVSLKYCFFVMALLITQFINLYADETNKENNESRLWSVRMAESIMSRNPNVYYNGNWDYVTGTVLKAFEELWRKTGDQRYFNYIKTTVDRVVKSDGTISGYRLSDYNIDEINEGRMLLLLYKETGDEKYKKAAELLRKQLSGHPRTNEGGFWHKQRYPWQMWLDGLYMGQPFYAEYCKLFNEPENFNDVVNQFVFMEIHSRDTETGLLYHGWDESKQQTWADSVTGCSQSFWGRAIGWYAMALVDVLDYLPLDHSGRDSVIAILQRLSDAVIKVQDDSTGVWWQVVDQGGREGNYLESSVSCMLTYAIAKGIRLGYIDKTYRPLVEKAYQGILNEFITENTDGTINLDQTCITAGLGGERDGTYEYYVNKTYIRSNDGKGLGPFITASLEMEMMQTSINKRQISTGFKLELHNYPNPFNSITKITYSLPNKMKVMLTVYNLVGQEVKRLVDEEQSAELYSINFDAAHFNSGIYFCRLNTGSGIVTKKMICLK